MPQPSRRAAAFLADTSALSALEFALILPIMVTLYIGGIQLGDALTINRKVTHVTSSLSDLVTQSKVLSNNDIKNIFDAAAAIVAPYNASSLKMRVTQIKIDNNNVSTVAWSEGRNLTALSPGTPVSIPAAVKTKNTWIVMAEVHYPYTPAVGYVMTGNYDLNDKFYLRPRLVEQITRIP